MRAPNTRTIQRASDEIAKGRLWRAKEILSGAIHNQGYSPELFAAYGRTLAQMGDSKEAGKYLFPAGVSTLEEKPLLDLYLGSVRGKHYKQILSGFPSSFRKIEFASLPDGLRSALNGLGFPESWSRRTTVGLQTTSRWGERAVVVGFGIVGLLGIGIIHGLYVVGSWIFGSQ